MNFPFLKRKLIRDRGQAMVEFALVLPILLIVIVGLFEFGRLIFIYSSVVTAAREAARYGSSSSWNHDPSIKVYEGQFRDCTGIKSRAQNVDFFDVFDDGEITIQYDHGPASGGTGSIPGYPSPFATCPPAATLHFFTGDRIVVQVTAQFTPMMGIVPIPSFTIRSISARTLLGMVVLDSHVPFQLGTVTALCQLSLSVDLPAPGITLLLP